MTQQFTERKDSTPMTIRTATMSDLDTITALEAACFPPAEAASRESFAQRLTYFADHFWLLEENGIAISCINGFVTNDPVLNNEMYADASQHDENGDWQMIFGVNIRARAMHPYL